MGSPSSLPAVARAAGRSATRVFPKRADRIVVLGGGPAGLSAARALRQAGYGRVTVLERERRVGGKCCTIEVRGRTYELGAAVISTQYPNVRRLLRETKTPFTHVTSGRFVDARGAPESFLLPPRWGERGLRAFGLECTRYAATVLRRRALWRPGFAHVSPDLHVPFEIWARRNGYAEVLELARPWFTGFGYGYLEEIPAAYVLKYMTVCGLPLAELLDGGFQGLWARVARDLDVRCKVEVTKIVRGVRGVTLETSSDGRLEADWLVLACPLEGALGVLDATADERALFGRVRHVDYRVVAATVSGLRAEKFTFCAPNLSPDRRGEPMFWYRRWREEPVYTFYMIDDGSPLEATVGRLETSLHSLGARMTEVHDARAWRYFPHVDQEGMDADFYGRAEALQGERRTFYTGELMAFPTVETVIGYSAGLVHRFFDGAGARPAFALAEAQ